MGQLTVRNVAAELRARARGAHGRSAEAEHREILRAALIEGDGAIATRAQALRRRLRSTGDSADVIRAARDRDGAS